MAVACGGNAFTRDFGADHTEGLSDDLDQLSAYATTGAITDGFSFTHDQIGDRPTKLDGLGVRIRVRSRRALTECAFSSLTRQEAWAQT